MNERTWRDHRARVERAARLDWCARAVVVLAVAATVLCALVGLVVR